MNNIKEPSPIIPRKNKPRLPTPPRETYKNVRKSLKSVHDRRPSSNSDSTEIKDILKNVTTSKTSTIEFVKGTLDYEPLEVVNNAPLETPSIVTRAPDFLKAQQDAERAIMEQQHQNEELKNFRKMHQTEVQMPIQHSVMKTEIPLLPPASFPAEPLKPKIDTARLFQPQQEFETNQSLPKSSNSSRNSFSSTMSNFTKNNVSAPLQPLTIEHNFPNQPVPIASPLSDTTEDFRSTCTSPTFIHNDRPGGATGFAPAPNNFLPDQQGLLAIAATNHHMFNAPVPMQAVGTQANQIKLASLQQQTHINSDLVQPVPIQANQWQQNLAQPHVMPNHVNQPSAIKPPSSSHWSHPSATQQTIPQAPWGNFNQSIQHPPADQGFVQFPQDSQNIWAPKPQQPRTQILPQSNTYPIQQQNEIFQNSLWPSKTTSEFSYHENNLDRFGRRQSQPQAINGSSGQIGWNDDTVQMSNLRRSYSQASLLKPGHVSWNSPSPPSPRFNSSSMYRSTSRSSLMSEGHAPIGLSQSIMDVSSSHPKRYGSDLFEEREDRHSDWMNKGFNTLPRNIGGNELRYEKEKEFERNLKRREYYLSMEELVQKRKQDSLRQQGFELVKLLREAEKFNFTADDLRVALNHCGSKQNPIQWLQDNWKNMVETVETLATNYGHDKRDNDVGILSNEEAKEALRHHLGNVWAAVTKCVENRQRKVNELMIRSGFSKKEVVVALSSNNGNMEYAFDELTKANAQPFQMKIWGSGSGKDNTDGIKREDEDSDGDYKPASDKFSFFSAPTNLKTFGLKDQLDESKRKNTHLEEIKALLPDDIKPELIRSHQIYLEDEDGPDDDGPGEDGPDEDEDIGEVSITQWLIKDIRRPRVKVDVNEAKKLKSVEMIRAALNVDKTPIAEAAAQEPVKALPEATVQQPVKQLSEAEINVQTNKISPKKLNSQVKKDDELRDEGAKSEQLPKQKEKENGKLSEENEKTDEKAAPKPKGNKPEQEVNEIIGLRSYTRFEYFWCCGDISEIKRYRLARKIRMLLAEGKCENYEQAETASRLLDMMFSEEQALQASKECADVYQALNYLHQDCELCVAQYPAAQMVSMVHCTHRACQNCAKTYFTLQIRDRNIMEAKCPFCDEPDLTDEDVAQDYFNHLDRLLKTLIDEKTYELFQRKLRDRVLMDDPNFKWCSQCSSGFIANPNLKKLVCPDCRSVMCGKCLIKQMERAQRSPSEEITIPIRSDNQKLPVYFLHSPPYTPPKKISLSDLTFCSIHLKTYSCNRTFITRNYITHQLYHLLHLKGYLHYIQRNTSNAPSANSSFLWLVVDACIINALNVNMNFVQDVENLSKWLEPSHYKYVGAKVTDSILPQISAGSVHDISKTHSKMSSGCYDTDLSFLSTSKMSLTQEEIIAAAVRAAMEVVESHKNPSFHANFEPPKFPVNFNSDPVRGWKNFSREWNSYRLERKAVSCMKVSDTLLKNVKQTWQRSLTNLRRSVWERKLNLQSMHSFTVACSERRNLHLLSSVICPASRKVCHKCNKTGHFAKCCRGAISQSVKTKRHPQRNWNEVHKVETSAESTSEEVSTRPSDFATFTFACAAVQGSAIFAEMIVGDRKVNFQLDSGASISPCKQNLIMYNKSIITPSGMISLTLVNPVNNLSFEVDFVVIPSHLNLNPILDCATCQKMNLITINYENIQHHTIYNISDCDFNNLPIPSVKSNLSVSPHVAATRSIPFHMRKKVKQHLDQLEKMGVITKQDEPTDWVPLNRALKREHFELPKLDDVLPELGKARHLVFSTFDCRNGFWHRLPGVTVMFDDILLVGSGATAQEAELNHTTNLAQLLERCRQRNIKLNPDKVKLRQTEVKFMGNIITQSGLKPDPDKIKAITEMPPPEDKTGKMVTVSPVLKYFNEDLPVQIQCDASQYGLGGVLMQEGKPVYYASRALTECETRYAQIEKELLSVLFSMKKFYPYVAGRKVTVYNDHKPLEAIITKDVAKAPRRLQRMLLELQHFDIDYKYQKGTELYIADMLSRSPDVLDCSASDEDGIQHVHLTRLLNLYDETLQKVQVETADDPVLQEIADFIKTQCWPNSGGGMSETAKRFYAIKDELLFEEGLLFKGDKAAQHNKKAKCLLELSPGDLVRIMPQQGDKWVLGRIRHQLGPRRYEIERNDGAVVVRNRVYLRKCVESHSEEWDSPTMPSVPSPFQSNGEVSVPININVPDQTSLVSPPGPEARPKRYCPKVQDPNFNYY
ncbi:Retrovirus-related Pol polyprotein from transposon 17.6 [Nymphon striatum]|nr:Retrovirus-related Pol polyprotein from transposon 17.6 [Nymphon striatum]